ncbi:hypothetical protein BGX29_002307 [Mortierella sp. GBA35]|nr:hypothetical protein BGX29_002307 [Mortierella sp. GBA35]
MVLPSLQLGMETRSASRFSGSSTDQAETKALAGASHPNVVRFIVAFESDLYLSLTREKGDKDFGSFERTPRAL